MARADLDAFDEDWESPSEYLELERRLRPEQVEELAAIVDKYPELYKRLEQAANCNDYQAKVDYSQGLMMLLPHVQHVRTAARAFSAKALVEAHRGNGDAALKQCELSLRLSSHLGFEPILISHLVNLACQAIAVLTANHTLRVAETSPDARLQLDKLLAKLDNRQAMVDAMKGERAMGVMTFQHLRDGTLDAEGLGEPDLSLSVFSSTWLGQAYLNDDEDKYIEVLDRQIDAVEMDRDERNGAMEAMWDEMEENSGFRHIMTRLLAPALNATVDATDRNDAKIRCLRVLLAIGRPRRSRPRKARSASSRQDRSVFGRTAVAQAHGRRVDRL